LVTNTDRQWKLPPLILHPFSEPTGPEKLLASSRASLMLQGVLPGEDYCVEELEHTLLAGRYCEISMLFYVGKDLARWAGQSMELVEHTDALRHSGIRPESFLHLLIENTPAGVDEKLRRWGVYEYKTIFSRAVGLHGMFQELPPFEMLSPDFVRYYHRFADHLYACRQQLFSFTPILPVNFDFELFSSAEYARLLESQWENC
jgi:hypothetical protein